MSLPPLPFISDYVTLFEYTDDILKHDKVETRRAIASGLSLLARGWADYLATREMWDRDTIVSDFIRDHISLC